MPLVTLPDRHRPVSGYLGAFYLVAAGINIGIVVTDGTVYRPMADGGLFPFVRTGWREIVMAHPGVWIGLLAAGEIAIGLAFLSRGLWPRAAYVAAMAFHGGLMLLGWGFWLWAVPALLGLLWAARHDRVFTTLRRPGVEARCFSAD